MGPFCPIINAPFIFIYAIFDPPLNTKGDNKNKKKSLTIKAKEIKTQNIL